MIEWSILDVVSYSRAGTGNVRHWDRWLCYCWHLDKYYPRPECLSRVSRWFSDRIFTRVRARIACSRSADKQHCTSALTPLDPQCLYSRQCAGSRSNQFSPLTPRPHDRSVECCPLYTGASTVAAALAPQE